MTTLTSVHTGAAGDGCGYERTGNVDAGEVVFGVALKARARPEAQRVLQSVHEGRPRSHLEQVELALLFRPLLGGSARLGFALGDW